MFRSITTSYFRNRHGILFCFDLTKKATFYGVASWLREYQQTQNGIIRTVLVLVGCKSDLINERKIEENEAMTFAEENGMFYVECSAKEFVIIRL